ncbi:MAG: DNA polymerase III subunit gamma/tau [Bacteroidales bacterium]|jgi:DNA polymerase-3 subunit gamma/tau|nr:DNA polymerase III subunit gamma/tau [Bacteroidales bacterium]
MDNFIVSARKYRPDNFESVVGQDAITQTLKNSIRINQLAQAYLFCGPRGVGKTTCARIFAKTINCSNLTEDFEACNECESCVAFNSLRSLNIHELDAASNNSVDDIRNLIDQVRIPPQIGSYSVYIIDEVHMLSSSAFNAFLKTLEEPPKHVIFILATTEKHKIIPTILSRCQVFDFNRIGVEDIRSRLEFVAQREGINAEHDALHIIAQKADGAMRDALSIFDQIVSFSGKEVTYESTIKNLNVLDYDTYFKVTDAFLSGNYSETLIILDSVLKKGFEAGYFINGLASHFRDLLVCKDPGTIDLLEVGNKIKAKYMEHSQKCSASFLFKAINIANQCDLSYKQSQNKRLLVELALLNICNVENTNAFEKETITNNSEKKTEENKIEQPKQPEVKQYSIPKDDHQPVSSEKQEPARNVTYQINTEASMVETPLNKDIPQNTIRNISIKDLATEVEKPKTQIVEDAKVEYVVAGAEEFDDEKLKYVWIKYAESLRENPRLFTFLTGHIPQKREGFRYVVVVENQAIKNKLETFLHDTVMFMRKELNNKNFELFYEIGDATVQKKVFKTDEEKLQDMIKINPTIQKFRDEFNLDFE